MRKETIVIKLSGKMLNKLNELVPQIKQVSNKYHIILVHGAKEQISNLMLRLNKEPKFIEGHRVTDKETLEIIKMVDGKLNIDFVTALESVGVNTVGLSGCDGQVILGDSDNKTGHEGLVTKINLNLIRELIDKYVIVLLPLAYDSKLKTAINIDADDLATKLARTAGATKMMILGEVKGLLDKNGEIINRLTTKELDILIEEGTVKGGMIPKMRACIAANLPKVWILDGNEKNVILRALDGEKTGTMIVGK
ncbi:acetylglutamate kinase [Candidatus Micrarchaeota archaeon]|nr:acetylglutamate kinase [Candidatus Micrarchaeota archaeon]